jgi:hypothetical protein
MVEQSATTTVALQGEAVGLDKLVSQFTTRAEHGKSDRHVPQAGGMRAVA